MTSTLLVVDFTDTRKLLSKSELILPDSWNPSHPSLWDDDAPKGAA